MVLALSLSTLSVCQVTQNSHADTGHACVSISVHYTSHRTTAARPASLLFRKFYFFIFSVAVTHSCSIGLCERSTCYKDGEGNEKD